MDAEELQLTRRAVYHVRQRRIFRYCELERAGLVKFGLASLEPRFSRLASLECLRFRVDCLLVARDTNLRGMSAVPLAYRAQIATRLCVLLHCSSSTAGKGGKGLGRSKIRQDENGARF
jgi:hypothetical protein